MTYRGHIQDGVVVFDEPPTLPEGTLVDVQPARMPIGRRRIMQKTASRKKKAAKSGTRKPPTLAERMRPFIGSVKDLPPDMSVNLDHYLYGLPKQDK